MSIRLLPNTYIYTGSYPVHSLLQVCSELLYLKYTQLSCSDTRTLTCDMQKA
jgi:hypothetical protein